MNDASHGSRPICNYEGSAYRTEFWGQGRGYEDGVEREAMRALLPPKGRRLIEIGAGFGRLAPLYAQYDEVVFFDYALSQLRQARTLWGDGDAQGGPRYYYVAGDFYSLPFAPGVFDTVVMVRTIHHAVDAPAVLREVARVLSYDGAFVLEFANKRNLKAIIRYLVHRQDWSPFERAPVEFVTLNLDFHPAWMRDRLIEMGLIPRQWRTVSHFRVEWLKRHIPTGLLVALDRLLQPTGACCRLSPSVFVRCAPAGNGPVPQVGFYRCPVCGSASLDESQESMCCEGCGARYPVQDGLRDFRPPSGREV
ncbi:MAG: methyltransferase domain-containing protein [Chloroflexi bacterium]|nr:methyltransferase domain-containing protein [Chloroflexota bacterium]